MIPSSHISFPTIFGRDSKIIAGQILKPFDFQFLNQKNIPSFYDSDPYKTLWKTLQFSTQNMAFSKQVHGHHVEIIDKPGFYQNTDGFISSTPKVALVVKTADCIPVLCYQPEKKTIGTLHVGWEGSKNRIIRNFFLIAKQMFNCTAKDFKIWVGAGISKKNYEVSNNFKSYFLEYPEAFSQGEKIYFDNHYVVNAQLEEEGVLSSNIENFTSCCFEKENMHSFRRDREHSGRMLTFILLKDD